MLQLYPSVGLGLGQGHLERWKTKNQDFLKRLDMPITFKQIEHSYSQLPQLLFARVQPTPVTQPELLAVNDTLAETLHITRNEITCPDGVAVFAGNTIPDGAEPIALAYAGHQFGHLVPQLGDGRAILLGEIIGRDGKRYDVQLKGAGRTPYSRRGDGRAALGPVLREYLVSEAMAALGVPTTRSLCAVATGEQVYREIPSPGAVLTRVALSHLRVGTFEYVALRRDLDTLERLTNYALARLYPDRSSNGSVAITLLEAVIEAQAELVAHWMALGFVHGVMNTDNMAISGETIDYGPCAFLDTYSPERTFSSIDVNGRYAFINQPNCAQWNLTRLAEALFPLVLKEGHDEAEATVLLNECLKAFYPQYTAAYQMRLRCKLGLTLETADDAALAQDLLTLMANNKVDYTLCFRRLVDLVEGVDASVITGLFADPEAIGEWLRRWDHRSQQEPRAHAARAALMRGANPAFIPRNHRIEEVIAAALQGDMAPFARLHAVLARPYEDQLDARDLALPPGEEQWDYRTFCGT